MVARRYAAVQQTAKLLNCRAIRAHNTASDAVAFVERNFHEAAIRTSVRRLRALIFLGLQNRRSGQADEGGHREHGEDKQCQNGEGFRHLILLRRLTRTGTGDMLTSARRKLCHFTQNRFGPAKVPAWGFYFVCNAVDSAGRTRWPGLTRPCCGGIAAHCLAPTQPAR